MKDIRIRKRNGNLQDVCYDKIDNRIKKLINDQHLGVLKNISVGVIVRDVISKVIDKISSSEIDTLSAQLCNDNCMEHPDYGMLASRISVSNLHKNTTECFSSVMESLYNNNNPEGEHVSRLSTDFINTVREHKELINSSIDYYRDYMFTYFGFKTLERSYLLKKFDETGKEVIAERPQHYLMRIALSLHSNNISDAIQYYTLSSQLYFTHGSPTIFNAGTNTQQMSSCFTMTVPDSMEGIYESLKKSAVISKTGGGLGLYTGDIRPKGSYIKGTNGKSDGIVKPLKVFNETARFSNQGSRRNGSFAVYLPPWHDDIFEFLELKLPGGKEENRARDLFYGLWVSDYFMKAVESDADWYLMGNDTSPNLKEAIGDEFDLLYNKYIKEGKYRRKVKARDIWNKILVSQIETGMPYIMYKDQVNKKTNQQNSGIVNCGNLCAEQIQITNEEEVSVCNISTVSLPKFVEVIGNRKVFNHQKLFDIVKIVTAGMDKVIDVNYYPVPETKFSNLKHRPIMIGCQGLCSVFFDMDIAYISEEARILNKEIYETVQFAALTSSCELAQKHGKYSTFEGSPASKGLFQHNMWGVEDSELSGRWDWGTLRKNVIDHGIRNSLLTASPPTASTSQILGNYESFEPIMNNMFMRSVLGGEYPIVNNHLIYDLLNINKWNSKIKNKIMRNRGSIQDIVGIPDKIKQKYLTTYEMSQKIVIDMSADRGLFTDQSQSLNIYMKNPTIGSLSTMHFYGWKKGLKTGSYYLRTLAKNKAEQFTNDSDEDKDDEDKDDEGGMCTIEDRDNGCLACSG